MPSARISSTSRSLQPTSRRCRCRVILFRMTMSLRMELLFHRERQSPGRGAYQTQVCRRGAHGCVVGILKKIPAIKLIILGSANDL